MEMIEAGFVHLEGIFVKEREEDYLSIEFYQSNFRRALVVISVCVVADAYPSDVFSMLSIVSCC